MTNAYYLPTGDKQKADWEAYRKAYAAHVDAARELATKIGAKRFRLGFGGSLVSAEFGKEGPHKAFSAKPNRYGAHPVLSRGRSNEQKEAIAWMEAENKALRDLRPDAVKIGMEHGFVCSVGYETDDGDKGFSRIGDAFDPINCTFAGMKAPIIIVAGDAQAQIDSYTSRYGEKPGFKTTPESFSTPEGYERISKAKMEFLNAQYEVEREERKAAGKTGDDEHD